MYKFLCAVSFVFFSVVPCAGVETKEQVQYDRAVFGVLLGYFPKELSQIIAAYIPQNIVIAYDNHSRAFVCLDNAGNVLKKISFKAGNILNYAYCGSGKMAVAPPDTMANADIYLVDIPTERWETHEVPLANTGFLDLCHSFVVDMAVLANGELALGMRRSPGDSVVVWNRFTQKHWELLLDVKRRICKLAALDTEKIAVGCRDGMLIVVDRAHRQEVWREKAHGGGISSLVGGSWYVASASWEHPLEGVRIWNIKNGTLLQTLQTEGCRVSCLMRCARGNLIVSNARGKTDMWNYHGGRWEKVESFSRNDGERWGYMAELDGELVARESYLSSSRTVTALLPHGEKRKLYETSGTGPLVVCPFKDAFPVPLPQEKRTYRNYLSFSCFRRCFKKKRE